MGEQVVTPGEYRLTVFEPRPVKVVRWIITPLGQSGAWWDVECASHGYTFKSAQTNLGALLNEMEVLAWAASSSA